MYLKNYQKKVVDRVESFLTSSKAIKHSFEIASQALPQDMRQSLNWVEKSFESNNIAYNDRDKNGLGEHFPRVCIKVPTGGGKTLLGVETIREYQNHFVQRKTGLIVWTVPSETIYSQTIKQLKDKGNFYRQLLDQSSGNKTIILEKGQALTRTDVEENLVILFIMIQSISRKNGKEGLKIFQDCGGYESFFPQDHNYTQHKELLQKVPNLETWESSTIDSFQPQVKTSLGNVIRLTNPLIIIDEIHKVFSDTARETINHLNPSLVVGLTATPKADMNILVRISGTELKEEEMIKLDLHVKSPTSNEEKDWKDMLRRIKAHREELETTATEFKQQKDLYIRPIALIQVERTGTEQRGKGFVHSLDVKEFLVQLGVPEHQVAIKTSSQNDIEDIELLSKECEIRYIITKDALREGWDCPFAYILGIIPNVSSNTGTTQLVGRILRQPYARKTKVKQLDESYAYFINGETDEMLQRIKKGFENDGLEDLIGKVQSGTKEDTHITKTTQIKPLYKDNYEHSLYLPYWLIQTGTETYRRFNYEVDIVSKFDFDNVKLQEYITETIKPSLSQQSNERQNRIVTIEAGQTIDRLEIEYAENSDEIDLAYFTRRLNEVIENTFKARIKAKNAIKLLQKVLTDDEINDHFGYIVNQITNFYNTERLNQEKKLFTELIRDNQLILGVSDDQKYGFLVPRKDEITINPRVPETFDKYLYENYEPDSFNSLEKEVGKLLDKQDKVLWWFRNKTSNDWYAIQGWKKNKIRPDFVASKKTLENELDVVYILESKGEQLVGNPDSTYKTEVFNVLNSTPIVKVQKIKSLDLDINSAVQFHMITQDDSNDPEGQIRTLFT